MLSWRRRVSLPAPGRHKGRIPEWHTETRTDIRTVVQHAVGAGPPHTTCCDETDTGAVDAQPPELRAMSRAPQSGSKDLAPVGECKRCPLLLCGLGGPTMFIKGVLCYRQALGYYSLGKFFHIYLNSHREAKIKHNRKCRSTSLIYVRREIVLWYKELSLCCSVAQYIVVSPVVQKYFICHLLQRQKGAWCVNNLYLSVCLRYKHMKNVFLFTWIIQK